MGAQNLLYLVFAAAMVNGIIGGIAVQSFLSGKKSIATTLDLANFKAMARQQMYQALLQMGLLGGGCLIGIYGILTGKIGLLLVIVLNGLVFIMGVVFKKVEEKARTLPVEDESLKGEYKRVCHSWLHKALPDF
jgi:hypothetical protein